MVYSDPMCVDLGASIWAARSERSAFALRSLCHLTKHFAAGGLVEFRLDTRRADCFQYAGGAKRRNIGCVLGDVKTCSNVALSAQMIDFIGPDLRKKRNETGGISEIGKVQKETRVAIVPVREDRVDTGSVETTRAALEAMHLVAFTE